MRSIALAGAVALGACAAFVLVRQGTGREAVVIGLLLVATGVPLLVLSRRQLGAAFSVGPRAKGLVTHGLYARIPHPMYVFLDIALLGAVIAGRRAWLLPFWVGLVGVQAWRARREARVLEQAYGAAYREYRLRTWW